MKADHPGTDRRPNAYIGSSAADGSATVFAKRPVTSKGHATRIMAKAHLDTFERGSRRGPSDRNPVLSALYDFAFGIARCYKEIFEHFGNAEHHAAALAETPSNAQRAALVKDYAAARTRIHLWQENQVPTVFRDLGELGLFIALAQVTEAHAQELVARDPHLTAIWPKTVMGLRSFVALGRRPERPKRSTRIPSPVHS